MSNFCVNCTKHKRSRDDTCARINVGSELENEVRSKDHGHVFGLAASDDGGPLFVNAGANDGS